MTLDRYSVMGIHHTVTVPLCDGYSLSPDVNHHLPLLTVVDVQVDFTPEEEASDDFPIL